MCATGYGIGSQLANLGPIHEEVRTARGQEMMIPTRSVVGCVTNVRIRNTMYRFSP